MNKYELKIIKQAQEWFAFIDTLDSNIRIGFVPTMGNLHSGHLHLFQKSCSENDITIASIFVNPTQFNDKKDFLDYPKTLEKDLALLATAKVDFVFLPDYETLYPDDYRYRMTESDLSLLLEGQARPGHFDGVLTVVMKLLSLFRPHRAYFGEKDHQQYLLIKGMAQAFLLPTDVILCETIREKSGLAYSSRNNLLSPAGREKAALFFNLLKAAISIDRLKHELQTQGFIVDYITEYAGRRYAAVFLESIRLIDNVKV